MRSNGFDPNGTFPPAKKRNLEKNFFFLIFKTIRCIKKKFLYFKDKNSVKILNFFKRNKIYSDSNDDHNDDDDNDDDDNDDDDTDVTNGI